MREVTINPSENHLNNIEEWLIEEYNRFNKGFYCNWNIITNAFTEKRLSVITENDIAIGFVVYRISDLTAEIDIAEIKPAERKKGIAKELINSTLDYFKTNGTLVTQLFCSPENSESFWKNMGFLNFPEFPHNSQIKMFKPLIQTLKLIDLSESENDDEIIELWNEEPYRAERIEPKWKWKLNFKKDGFTLDKPIIFPAHYDWQICWRKGNLITEKDKVKYFKSEEILNSNFIIIRKLKTNKNTKHNKVYKSLGNK